MLKKSFLVLLSALALGACSTSVQTNPARSATEQMLISTAAERSAGKLALQIPAKSSVFVDNGNFEGTDSKYAIGAIRASLLQKGIHLVDDRKQADVIIETRSGALSIDQDGFLIGIPAFTVPIPLASGPVNVPEIALYGTQDQKGVAKFAVTGYNPKTGELVSVQEPQYGYAHNTKTTLLIFISWSHTDAVPDEDDVKKNDASKVDANQVNANKADASTNDAKTIDFDTVRANKDRARHTDSGVAP